MYHKKALIVSTYPIRDPQNGGQKRAKAIYELYKTLFAEVKYLGVFHKGSYKNYAQSDITLGDPALINEIEQTPYFSDIISGRAIAEDIHVRSAIAKLLMDYQPDLVQVEQVYPYFGLESLMKDINLWPRLIYSSHNVEYKMKNNIYEMLGIKKEESNQVIEQIRTFEKRLSKRADLTIAVSRNDANELKWMGAKKIVIAPNGIDKKEPSPNSVQYWREYKSKHKIKNLITFIASGHPPNWQGLHQMVGDDTSFLPDGTVILLAGSISSYASKVKDPNYPQNRNFWNHVRQAGTLSEAKLTGLIEMSEIILLPITSGGGSNLKTAEALLSGKKVVATNYAFRTYENYKALPNIFIADSSKDFRLLLLKALKSNLEPYTQSQRRLIEKVQWQFTLAKLPLAVAGALEDNLRIRLHRVARVQSYKYEKIIKLMIVSIIRKFGYK